MSDRNENRLGRGLRRISPRLRMIANGDDGVNSIRAQMCAGLRVAPTAKPAPAAPAALGATVQMLETSKVPRSGDLVALPSRTQANVFVTRRMGEEMGDDPARNRLSDDAGFTKLENRRERGNLVSGAVRISDLPALAANPSVIAIELAEALKAPTPTLGDTSAGAPSPSERQRLSKQGGEGVLIGIVDVQGFDFAHEDFLGDDGKTRFLRIWDQGGTRREPPARFGYGSLLDETHLAGALAAQATHGVPATEYEPQSSMDVGSHGTHVASIAAGKLGVCHKSQIVAVLLSLPETDFERRKSFYDSTRLADAVDYLLSVAEELGRPISINVSLGTNGHAHDGSSAVSRWIDSALTVPGRAVCVAAGNAGQDAPQSEEDLGYIVGRIHTEGRIAARGLTTDLDWLVIGSGVYDISENELELWYSPSDRFAISVKPPGQPWTKPLEPGEFIENRQLPDGAFLSIYNEIYNPANGSNYIAVYLTPFLSETAVKGVTAGTWRVRLYGREVRDGRFHGWIERDDPVRRDGSGTYWSFPSFFAENSNVDRNSVSTLACGHNVVGVANLDAAREVVNVSSSQGPTRDGRSKPEVAAPGTNIRAARGFHGAGEDAWIEMTGTSMASPYVAGVVGLMLAQRPTLTAAQVLGILQCTAKPLPGHDYAWRNDAGYGRIDPVACLADVDAIDDRSDRT